MKRTAWSLAILLGSVTGLAQAATCTVSATTVAFGSYNPLNATATDSIGDVAVSCTGGVVALLVSYQIKLSAGGSGSYAPRRMSSGANTLNYNLYTSVLRTTVWGDGSGGTGTISDGFLVALLTLTQHHVVYGRLSALQNVAGGSYADTITVTVEY